MYVFILLFFFFFFFFYISSFHTHTQILFDLRVLFFLVCQILHYPGLLCFLLLLFSVYLLEPEEDDFCRNRLCTIVSLCFVVLVSTFP